MGEPLLDRAFRVIDAFSEDETSMSLTRLSEVARLPLSTTLRLAQHLVRLGALERRDTGNFNIGIWLLERATLAPRGHGLRAIALPFMEDLHRATGQHVLLGVREGDHVVLTERLSALRAGKVDYRVGGRLPLHDTSIGLVLLAHSRAEFQRNYLDQPLHFDGDPATPVDLAARLEKVRMEGVARLSRRTPEPLVSVAAPILQHGTVTAALSVVGADGALRLSSAEPAVVAIARAVSRELSRRPKASN